MSVRPDTRVSSDSSADVSTQCRSPGRTALWPARSIVLLRMPVQQWAWQQEVYRFAYQLAVENCICVPITGSSSRAGISGERPMRTWSFR